MDLNSHFQRFALYNQRMNQQLLPLCAALTHEQVHQDTGAFFPSVMAHWNHLLFGDLIMLQRLEACGIVQLPKEQSSKLPKSEAIDQQFVTTIDVLTPLRTLLDKLYIDFINGLTPACFNQTVSYTSTEGYRIETPLAHYLQHIFNHQTHHRGQLTCVLSQMGVDFGCTDLPMIVPEGYSIDKT